MIIAPSFRVLMVKVILLLLIGPACVGKKSIQHRLPCSGSSEAGGRGAHCMLYEELI